jgi:hypothetical protein
MTCRSQRHFHHPLEVRKLGHAQNQGRRSVGSVASDANCQEFLLHRQPPGFKKNGVLCRYLIPFSLF